jgi:hypothetical protein
MPNREEKEKKEHKRAQESHVDPAGAKEERMERHSVHKPHAQLKPTTKKEGAGGKGSWGSVNEVIKEGIMEQAEQEQIETKEK